MSKNYLVFTDGGARGNPGPAAAGFFIKDSNEKILHKGGKHLGVTTNNVAEYSAVIESLNWIINNESSFIFDSIGSKKLSTINYYLDSQLVVNQLNGTYKIRNLNLQKLIIEIKYLEKRINAIIIYNLIPRTKNKIADHLVNEILDNL